MNDWKCAIILATCCGIILTVAPSASADFVGVTIVTNDDPDTVAQCNSGAGAFNLGFGPITVCNVFAVFDNPDNTLLSVGNADLQVYNGANPDVFYQHPFNFAVTSPSCAAVRAFPDLICDSFIAIGYKCDPGIPLDATTPDNDFSGAEFAFNGHIVGGWFNSSPPNGQGAAGYYPDLQVLFLQSSVAQGLSLSGDIDLFWWDEYNGVTYAELDVPIQCGATCGSCPTDTDGDGDTDAADLAVLLGSWGPCGPGEPCECLDNDTSGSIGAFDLAVLLGNWGPCL